MDNKIRLSERELKCLIILRDESEYFDDDDSNWWRYADIAKEAGLTFSQARRSVRALVRKGMAIFSRLYDNDGFMKGSGHHISKDGLDYLLSNKQL